MTTTATETDPVADGPVTRQTLLAYEKKRTALEEEISELITILNTPPESGGKAPGLRGNLNDEEGFPRADIEHFTVKRQRSRLNHLQTDLSRLMKKIEHGLLQVMANKQKQVNKKKTSKMSLKEAMQKYSVSLPTEENSQPESNLPSTVVDEASTREALGLPVATTTEQEQKNQQPPQPFAIVDDVSPQSPAKNAGLKVGDKIVAFGSVTHVNHEQLANVAKELRAHVNQTVQLQVQRADAVITLQLTPQQWAGRGLLGCHILPL